ncbi:hypothetical protein GE061_015986 [Apolygus lucorum]|uniref:Peptidase S1 domain-containing protein n=1 Tax=Apolygus lucorum TaxID=248454 RepID=A0A8S9XG42_APOLU|nr:hypothetical protein GE061_015986 [Apolygus lucorum]
MYLLKFFGLFVFLTVAAGQNAVINLKASVTKTKFKLPKLPSKDAHVRATYTIVAPEDKRVLLRCENEGEIVECTEGTLQVINGLPKGFACKRNLNTLQTRVTLSIVNFNQVSDKTTCEAYSISGMSAAAASGEEEEEETSTKSKGSRRTSCDCGWTNQKRIVGGTVAKQNEFIWMTGLVHKSTGSRFCGAAIISDDIILTAAHCLDNMQPRDIEVVVGDHDMKGRVRTKAEQKIAVRTLAQHERWDTKKLVNDIALVKLADKIKFSQDVGPVCLPSGRSSLVGSSITAMGWGLTQTLFERDRGLLRKVDLKVVDIPTCSASYGNTINTRQVTQLCTYGKNKDTCQGDSGGPLVWMDPETNRYTQVALVSYGKKCGSASPAVNTDVSAYMDWIRTNMRRLSPGKAVCTKV